MFIPTTIRSRLRFIYTKFLTLLLDGPHVSSALAYSPSLMLFNDSSAMEYSAKALLFKAESTKLRFLVYSV